jgi:dimethylhistidine N-methyltransferase
VSTPPNLHLHDLAPPPDDFRAAVLAGLASRPRRLSPKFFYDARGSQLFDAITRLPEYYPTRTEIALLREHGAEIAALLGDDCVLVELGSGSDVKIQVLLDALRPRAYVPIDISREHLWRSARATAEAHPHIAVHALCADYTRAFALPAAVARLRRAAFYPGSSIGNFAPAQAVALLRGVAALLGAGGRLLIGVDLKKDVARLEAAYDDAQGVTAQFNRNVLVRMRDELGADIDPDGFRHRAFYDAAAGRIEMHLVATRAQTVRIGDACFGFAAGDDIHTENSYKYDVAEFGALAAAAGFATLRVWRDRDALFSVHCLAVARRPPA